jgi:hypothetical protein
MRVMVLVKATEDSENGLLPEAADFAAMDAFNAMLQEAGVLVTADGLRPTSHGKRIAFEGAERRVLDGPFGPADHQVAGFWIWEVADMDEAVAWVKQCPNPMPGPSTIEIRPFYEMSDFQLPN